MLDAADRQAMLDAVGVEAVIGGTFTITVLPPIWPTAQIELGGGGLTTVNPYCLAEQSEVDSLALVGGERITVSSRDYTVLSLEPDNSGFVAVELGV